jgi:hypothetical protein
MATKFDSILSLAADSRKTLRASDVDRVMGESLDRKCLAGFKKWLLSAELDNRVKQEIESWEPWDNRCSTGLVDGDRALPIEGTMYETIEQRDAKLSTTIGKLCASVRDDGYFATNYGSRLGSYRVEFSKKVRGKRVEFGVLEIKSFGPVVLTGPVPQEIRALCAGLVVP